MGKSSEDLFDRVLLQSPEAIQREVQALLSEMEPAADLSSVRQAAADCLRLYRGEYPGYQRCKTLYHDVNHALAVYLATARLMHGAFARGQRLPIDLCTFTLINAVFHDAGLIQSVDDTEGTGAKYTTGHEVRSIRFVKLYLAERELFTDFIDDCAHIIGCTIVGLPPTEISFRSDETRLMGCILGSADLMAQMADRLYLEKLLYLYREFQEAGMSEFSSELDLLKKTESFYRKVSRQRLQKDLLDVASFMTSHFAKRLGLDRDIYRESTENNIVYLRKILLKHEQNYRDMLRRAGIVASLEGEQELRE